MSASLPGFNDVSAWSDCSGGNWPWCELESIPLLTLEVRRLCRVQFCAILYSSKFALSAESSGALGNYPRYSSFRKHGRKEDSAPPAATVGTVRDASS